MGSFFAGVKAGTLAGIVYIGGLVLFNVALLYLFKADALVAITNDPRYAQVCPAVRGVNGISVEDCFNIVVSIYPEYLGFLGFFLTLFYSALFGRFYEYIPGSGPVRRGATMAAVVGLSIVLFGVAGVSFTPTVSLALGSFLVAWTVVLGVSLGKLYARYPRTITFGSNDEGLLRITVDGRDHTGKTRTFAVKSLHKLRAEVSVEGSFKEWTVSGGVKLEDSKSFETEMEIEGDGQLSAQVGKKY